MPALDTNNGLLSPAEFERQQKLKSQGVYEIRGTLPGFAGFKRGASIPSSVEIEEITRARFIIEVNKRIMNFLKSIELKRQL
ncbi:MAG: hypothetical protein ACTSY1_00515 [Alphaproteobacteria bacterium]